MFPLLFWLISLFAVVAYLASWPARRPWPTRLGFDGVVLVLLVLLCVMVRPGVSSDPRQAAEASQWQPHISAIYVAALSIIFLILAGTVRHFVFRTRPRCDLTHLTNR
jgi:NADH:ubiquinone oxidoreductase subunit 4 (subunit M)